MEEGGVAQPYSGKREALRRTAACCTEREKLRDHLKPGERAGPTGGRNRLPKSKGTLPLIQKRKGAVRLTSTRKNDLRVRDEGRGAGYAGGWEGFGSKCKGKCLPSSYTCGKESGVSNGRETMSGGGKEERKLSTRGSKY